MEELRIEVLLVMEHAPDGVEQAAHDGDEGDLLLFAAGEQGFVGGLDLRAALDGDQGGHEERAAQMPVAGAADVPRGIGGSALAGPRIEPGVGDPLFGFQAGGQDQQFAQETQGAESADAGDAAESLDLDGEFGLVGRQFGGRLLQGFEALLEMADVRGQVGGDEAVAIRREGDGVEPGLFAGQLAAELDQPAAKLLQGQHGLSGRRPGHELHALQELKDAEGIDAIGLGAGEPGALEVFNGPRIDDHDLDPRGALQSQRQAQAVNAGGFQADPSGGSAPGEQLEELAMTGRRVGQGAGTFRLAVAEDRHDQFGGADIKAGTNDCRLFHTVVLGLVWSLREPDSVQMSSTDLVNAGSPSRQRGGGLRYSPAWTKESGDRSNEQGRGGAVTPPCPQASAASRKRAHAPQFMITRTTRFAHGCEIQGVARVS
jgi:hypothetical protein